MGKWGMESTPYTQVTIIISDGKLKLIGLARPRARPYIPSHYCYSSLTPSTPSLVLISQWLDTLLAIKRIATNTIVDLPFLNNWIFIRMRVLISLPWLPNCTKFRDINSMSPSSTVFCWNPPPLNRLHYYSVGIFYIANWTTFLSRPCSSTNWRNSKLHNWTKTWFFTLAHCPNNRSFNSTAIKTKYSLHCTKSWSPILPHYSSSSSAVEIIPLLSSV